MTTAERKRMALEQAANQEGFVMNEDFQRRFLDLVQNEFLSRGAFIQRWMDPRRDYNKECGYPETYEVTSEKWQDYYERHPVAARVVELMPSECWQMSPDIIEDEDPSITTPFEQALEDLGTLLRSGTQSLFRPDEKQAHPLWEMCKRVDIQSGIGQYGLMLLGFDDGKSMNQPVEGWQEPQVGNITWNEEALPFLHEHVSQYITINERGQLVWNAPPDEEEDPKKAKGNGKKQKTKVAIKQDPNEVKKVTDKENMQSSKGYMPPEPQGDSMPSPAAFGNVNPQQGKYRDPMDVMGQKNIVPYGDQQPKPGAFTTKGGTSSLQPFQESTDGAGLEQPSAGMPQQGRKLLYIRVFPESLVQIMQYEQNMASPRFGQPVMYRITLNDPMQNYTGVGLPLSTVEVHYSRVIHVADNLQSSEIFGASRMRCVLNNLIDLQKIYSACGEGYWKSAFATLAAETHPQLGGDVTLDVEAMRSQMKKWRDSLDRVLAATGVTWKTIAPSLIDPNSFVANELQAICIKLGCPLRIFMGSEQGVLAADQDARAWYWRVRERRKNYLTPRLIVPLIDRLINVGVLPTPQSYSVKWDDEQKLMPNEQAQIAGALTGAFATYISGQVDQFIEPITYLVEVCGWDRDKATAVIEATMEHIKLQQEQQAMEGQQMIDPRTGQPLQQDPQTGEYIDSQTGEPVQTDEFGKPILMDPQTGQPISAQQQSPQESQGPLGAEAKAVQREEQGDVQGMAEPQPLQEEQPEDTTDLQGAEQVPPEEEQAQAQSEIDPDTGLPIDPQTGMLIDEQSGYLIDKDSGDVIDPQSGEVLGNLFEQDQQVQEQDNGEDATGQGVEQQTIPPQEEGDTGEETPNAEDEGPGPQEEAGEDESGAAQPTDPETGFPIDPRTGYLINPQNNYSLDPNTGNIYDPEGNLWGNIEDEDSPQEQVRSVPKGPRGP